MAPPTLPRICGVYKITCSRNGRSYIGSSENCRRRWNEHQSKLRHGAHQCRGLQMDWQRYGRGAFTFEVVEECEPTDLLTIEAHWTQEI